MKQHIAIFLDFDGVICPIKKQAHFIDGFNPNAIRQLIQLPNFIQCYFPNIDFHFHLIFSTSWREFLPKNVSGITLLKDIKIPSVFHDELNQAYQSIDTTPILDTRYQEIKSSIDKIEQQINQRLNFVVIDDIPELFYLDCYDYVNNHILDNYYDEYYNPIKQINIHNIEKPYIQDMIADVGLPQLEHDVNQFKTFSQQLVISNDMNGLVEKDFITILYKLISQLLETIR